MVDRGINHPGLKGLPAHQLQKRHDAVTIEKTDVHPHAIRVAATYQGITIIPLQFPARNQEDSYMPNRLPIKDNLCTNPANHKSHLCELVKHEQRDKIEKLMTNPRFICNNCGQKANKEGALCAPGPHHN